MGDFPRKADGRRIFTAEFKRGVVQQILKGEKTLAEVSREQATRFEEQEQGEQDDVRSDPKVMCSRSAPTTP
jgi:hypothetical protein